MRIQRILMGAALLLCAQAAWAAATPPAPAAERGKVVRASAAEAFGTPVTERQLASLRGGADTVNNDMRLNGAVSGNTALNVATGMNTISSGSFSNAAGLPVAIQNSGANVLIQNATIINIQLQ